MRIMILAAALCFGLSTVSQAQVYPEPSSATVNDSANMIDSITENRLEERLAKLRDDTGVEMTILTLSSVRFYAEDTPVSDYAGALFDSWGIGDAETNDGILMLVFRDDRELNIKLGQAYGTEWDDNVQTVVDNAIIPQFREGAYAAGIEAGAEGLITEVVMPFRAPPPAATGNTPPAEKSNTIWYILGAIGAAIAALVVRGRKKAAAFAATPCPNCGKPGLTKERVVLEEPTLEAEGHGENRVVCPSCGHVTATAFTLSKLKPEAPEKTFGGGKSDGGGAGGKW